MKIQIVSSLLAIALLAGSAQARSLQQSFSSSSAVSVSGGSGPYGNCGSTQVIGTGSAYASGPPCPGPESPGATAAPVPPVTPTPPGATLVFVDWTAGKKYEPLTVTPGSTISFRWNTGSANVVYGLYRIPSSTCPTAATDPQVELLITPASSPNPSGAANATISVPGTYYFTDIKHCPEGQLQQVIVATPPASGRKL